MTIVKVTPEFSSAVADLRNALPDNSIVEFLARAQVGDFIFTTGEPEQ